jgi:hypothetical protein
MLRVRSAIAHAFHRPNHWPNADRCPQRTPQPIEFGGGRSPDRTGLHSQIPDKWEIKWEFFRIGGHFKNFVSVPAAKSVACTKIPVQRNWEFSHGYLGIYDRFARRWDFFDILG